MCQSRVVERRILERAFLPKVGGGLQISFLHNGFVFLTACISIEMNIFVVHSVELGCDIMSLVLSRLVTVVIIGNVSRAINN